MKTVPTQIRLPQEIHRRLKQEAKKNYRSLNSEYVKRLAESLGLETEDVPIGKVTRLKIG